MPQEDLVEETTPENILPGLTRKAFGELGAALRLTARVPELHENHQVSAVRTEWLRIAARRNVFFDVRRRVHLFPHAVVALAVFRALNIPAVEAKNSLQNVLDRGFMDRTERSAWQKLDLKYYLDAAGLRHSFPSDRELLRASCLLSPPALAYAISYDIYAVTHLIFHFTDFGACTIDFLSDQQLTHMDDYVRNAIASYLYDQDFDLVAELLICRRCLRRPIDDLDRVAAARLCDAQQPSGFIPDVSWLRGLPCQFDAEAEAKQMFAAVYHPTVVALFLLACERMHPPAQAGTC